MELCCAVATFYTVNWVEFGSFRQGELEYNMEPLPADFTQEIKSKFAFSHLAVKPTDY